MLVGVLVVVVGVVVVVVVGFSATFRRRDGDGGSGLGCGISLLILVSASPFSIVIVAAAIVVVTSGFRACAPFFLCRPLSATNQEALHGYPGIFRRLRPVLRSDSHFEAQATLSTTREGLKVVVM